MRFKNLKWLLGSVLLIYTVVPTITRAHEPETAGSTQVSNITDVVGVVEDATSPADLTWMLVASALVLFMTAPGLAMFYSGLVRKKNVIAVMMHCLFLMGLMSVVWGFVGIFAGIWRGQ